MNSSNTNIDSSQSITFKNTAFQFSGAGLNTLDSAEYTLVDIEIDSSYSINNFVQSMREVLKAVVRGLQKSPRSDNLLLRIGTFDQVPREFHGFTELNKCDLTKYDSLLNHLGPSTALYDASVSGIDALNTYGKELAESDYTVNALFIAITDGMDNNSTYNARTVRDKLVEGVGEKKLESLTSILIGVNVHDANAKNWLSEFQNEAEFTKYEEMDKVDDKAFAKLAGFISQSISKTSTSLNTGNAPSIQSVRF